MPNRTTTPLAGSFRPWAWELDGRIYRWLGVVLFKKALMRLIRPGPGSPASNAYVLGGRSLADVRAFDRAARRSERMHCAGLAMGLAFLGIDAIWGGLLVPGLIVVGANFHCWALQRYNRGRVWRLLRRRAGAQ